MANSYKGILWPEGGPEGMPGREALSAQRRQGSEKPRDGREACLTLAGQRGPTGAAGAGPVHSTLAPLPGKQVVTPFAEVSSARCGVAGAH